MAKKTTKPAKPQLTAAQILGQQAVTTYSLPVLDNSVTISELTRNIAANLPQHSLFRYKNKLVTISAEQCTDRAGNTYTVPKVQEMEPKRFATWVEQHMLFCKNAVERNTLTSLGDPKIKQILAADSFISALPVVREICPVRMPVWQGKKQGVKLARKGYDPTTELYTLEAVRYPAQPLPLEDCRTQLHELLAGFPWADVTDGSRTFYTSRNVASFICYTVGQYCRHMLNLQPMVLFNANQQGSGKTLLAAIGLAPIHGAPTVTPYPDNDDELRQTLFSKLAGGASYCLLDDLPTLTSKTINQFTTAPSLSLRKMYSQVDEEHPNTMQLISTGNDLRTTTDVERRAMIIDLFSANRVTEVEHKNHMDIFHLNSPALRARLLTVLWSMVHHWSAAGCPTLCPPNSKASFESFAAIAGSITRHAGFSDPFERRVNPGTGGDTAAAMLEQLLTDIASASCPQCPSETPNGARELTVQEVLDAATNKGIADVLCSGYDKLKSLGLRLSKLKGRRFTDAHGRVFQFGRRRSVSRTLYDIIFFAPGENPDAEPAQQPAPPEPAAECPF